VIRARSEADKGEASMSEVVLGCFVAESFG
jgi:hypothetical protein